MRRLDLRPVWGLCALLALHVVPAAAGPPFPTLTDPIQSVIFVDLDGDSANEVVFATHSPINGFDVHAYTYNGVHLWTTTIPEYFNWHLVAGHVDDDGTPEIVITTQIGPFSGFSCSIYVLENDGSIQNGWPQSDLCISYASPILADLDKSTKAQEILVIYSGWDGLESQRIEAWSGDGQLLWQRFGIEGYFYQLATAELDGVYPKEIIAPLNVWTFDGPAIHVDSRLTVTTADGVALPDLVTVPEQRMVGPTVGDLDGDGKPEIVVFTIDANDPQKGWLRVFDKEGNTLPGWPLGLHNPYGFEEAPVVGDLDGDGDLEIVYSTLLDRVYAWHHDATPLPGWPLVDPLGHGVGRVQPLLGDADGDPGVEVVLFTDGCFIEAYEATSQPSLGYPLATNSGGSGSCWFNEAVMGRAGPSTRLAYGLATWNPNVVKIRWVNVHHVANRAHWPVMLHDNHRTSEHTSP